MIKLETGSFHYSLSPVSKFFIWLQRFIDQSTDRELLCICSEMLQSILKHLLNINIFFVK